jgi:hypothetical protein
MNQPRYSVEKLPPGGPVVYPITTAELADWLGVDNSDPLLSSLIATATELCEQHLGMAFITANFIERLDFPPGYRQPWWDGVQEIAVTVLTGGPSVIVLHRAPLVSVASVTFYDDNDNATVADVDSYYVSSKSRSPRIALRQGYTWPSVVLRVADAVAVAYSAGFGATSANVPADIKSAVKALAAFLYEHRGACDPGDALIRSGAAAMLASYRRGML